MGFTYASRRAPWVNVRWEESGRPSKIAGKVSRGGFMPEQETYSYGKTGIEDAQEALAAPVSNTLFFAGEATDIDGHNGTVHGAIASGRRAAAEILRAAAADSRYRPKHCQLYCAATPSMRVGSHR